MVGITEDLKDEAFKALEEQIRDKAGPEIDNMVTTFEELIRVRMNGQFGTLARLEEEGDKALDSINQALRNTTEDGKLNEELLRSGYQETAQAALATNAFLTAASSVTTSNLTKQVFVRHAMADAVVKISRSVQTFRRI